MTSAQIELALDDPRAEPVPPEPREILVDIEVNLTLWVDVAKLAFLHRDEIQSDETTEMLRSDGYSEEERFDVWLHYYLLDGAGLDVWAPRTEGIRESLGGEPEVNFRLSDEDRQAVEGGLDPRLEIPAAD